MSLHIENAKTSRSLDRFIPNPKLKLLEQASEVQYCIRTETCYWDWIRRFILLHGKRHLREMGAADH